MHLSNSKLFSLTIALLGGVWCIGICVVAGLFEPSLRFVGGMTGGVVAIAVSLLYLMRFRRSPGKQAVEVGALSIYFTAVYVVVAIASNTALILLRHGELSALLLFCNLLVTAVYIVLILYAENNTRRISEKLERTAQKAAGPTNISAALGRILAKTEDGELRKHLFKLKEAVDYSSNITTGDTSASEEIMVEQLTELEEMITNQRDPAEILSKIREAEISWKTRSSQIKR